MCELVAEWDTQMRGIPAPSGRHLPNSWGPSEQEINAARRYAYNGSWDNQSRIIGDVPNIPEHAEDLNDDSDDDDGDVPYEGQEDDVALVEELEVELLSHAYRAEAQDVEDADYNDRFSIPTYHAHSQPPRTPRSTATFQASRTPRSTVSYTPVRTSNGSPRKRRYVEEDDSY